MDYRVNSLDNHRKRLGIYSIGGSAPGDLGIDTGYLSGVYLLSPMGAGNANFKSPVFDAAIAVMKMFNNRKGHLLQGFENKVDVDFSFNQADIITFAAPRDIPSICDQRLDFVRSKLGFFGINTRRGFDFESVQLEDNDIVWLCGPDDKNLAKKFGTQAYSSRRNFFGKLYEMAASDPPGMMNPVCPTEEGFKFIIKGNQNALH